MQRLIKNLLVKRKQLPHYTISVTWFFLILVLCWLPKSNIQEPSWFKVPNADKIVHFVLFFVWAFCLQVDLRDKHWSRTKNLFFILGLALFAAVLTEVLQPVISNRTKDWLDGAVDVMGAFMGWLTFPKVKNKYFRST